MALMKYVLMHSQTRRMLLQYVCCKCKNEWAGEVREVMRQVPKRHFLKAAYGGTFYPHTIIFHENSIKVESIG